MVYLHSFLLNYFPKRAARKKQFLMSVLTEQKLTKFQELPVSPPPPPPPPCLCYVDIAVLGQFFAVIII